MTKNRILIATGGTGGHIYPAIALAQQLKVEIPGCEILFIGGGLTTNRYFDQASFENHAVACGALSSFSPKSLASSLFNISKGIWQSQQIIRAFKPNVAVGFGSYYAFPPLVAAKLLAVPFILHEANSIPGKVNRLLSKWAEVTGVHFPETAHRLSGRTVEVGMPIRNGFKQNQISQAEARAHFGLNPDRKTLLVFGGSQGARAINFAVKDAIQSIDPSSLQILHIAGDAAMARELKESYAAGPVFAVVKAFEERMEIAWQAADIVLSRSGASTIAEQLEFEVPGILIPFPRAADNHQEHNADFMVATVGGGVKIVEKGLSSQRLTACLHEFLKDDAALLQAMSSAMQNYKKKARTKDLCSLVKEML